MILATEVSARESRVAVVTVAIAEPRKIRRIFQFKIRVPVRCEDFRAIYLRNEGDYIIPLPLLSSPLVCAPWLLCDFY